MKLKLSHIFVGVTVILAICAGAFVIAVAVVIG